MSEFAVNSRKIKRTPADLAFDIILGALGVLIFIIVVYPMYFVVLASFSDPLKVAGGEVWLWTDSFTLYGYQQVWQNARIWIGYRNTIFYTVAGTFLHLCVTLPAAYTLSRKNVMLRNPLMMLFTIAMFFSGGMIPTYFVYRDLGLLDTVWCLLLPGSLGIYNLIIARTFFSNNIPNELLDATQIDGCTDFRFYFQFVIPLSKAIIAVIALYNMVGVWNSYMDALLYIRNAKLVPLQLVLREILVSVSNDAMTAGTGEDVFLTMREQVKYGVIVVSTLPLMLVYPFLQKYFNKGVMIGAVKG